MIGVAVVDTHTAIWFLLRSQNLSQKALLFLREAAEAGNEVYLSSISLVEGCLSC